MTRSVVITGASTGIGRASVAELARRGWRVWATIRRERDAQALRQAHGEAVSPLLLDLTDEGSVRAAGETVRAAGPLHGLVNNAGVALSGPLEYTPIEVFRRQLEVNLTGQLLVTQAMLPSLRLAREEGADARIVMVGSMAGRVAAPMLGAYHAAKFGLVGLTDSLRAELAPFGIRVILVEPGAIATPIWERGRAAAEELRRTLPAEAEQRYAKQIRFAEAMANRQATAGPPPERAALAIATALTARNPRPRQPVGRDARLAGLAARLLPSRVLYRLTAARPDREPAATPSTGISSAESHPLIGRAPRPDREGPWTL
jgi:NAD(P)-dependent dehydrogenase (short-subunit alcohol dehydrogenase family)